jgi:tetratricopeptide (TPR) repeat protein
LEEAVIEDYTDTGVTSLASYYLIDCYFSLKNIPKLEEVIASFNLQHDEFLNTGALPVDYRDILPKILKRAIKCDGLDEMSVAKLKGMQAYVTQEIIPQYHDLKIKRTSKTLEGKVINEALKLTEEALAFYPSEGFFNTLYSNLLYNASQPDKAMDYKLRSIAKKDNGGLYANVSLSDCTEEYINNYAENLKKIFGEIDGDAARNYVEGYDFDSDVGTLWDRKLYAQISELYKFIKPQITDYSKIGELSDVLKGGGLFEVAYSLNESGDVDMAREAYEMHIKTKGESSAAYNNLAIIYEKKKNAAKAIELIKKAKELAGPDDELVNRNYQRICGNKQNDTQRPKAEASVPRSKPKLSFDEKTGQVHFGKNSVEIPLGSNQYQLCKAVFGVPIGTWVNESDVVDNFFRGKESKRGFYDAVRLANTRIEGELKVPRLIEYVASRARIRKEAMT